MIQSRFGYFCGVLVGLTLTVCLVALMIAGTARLFDWIMP